MQRWPGNHLNIYDPISEKRGNVWLQNDTISPRTRARRGYTKFVGCMHCQSPNQQQQAKFSYSALDRKMKTRKKTRPNFKKVTLLLFFMIPYNSISAAELEVRVKENGGGAWVEGATVVLEGSEHYQQTDAQGIVHFKDVTEGTSIKVLAPGFQTKTVKWSSTDSNGITVYMQRQIIDAGEYKVVAARLDEKHAKISLSKKELLQTPGTGGDPLKSIASLPGIVPQADDSAQVYMRGSSARDNIVWANRAPIGYLYHFGGLYSTINPDLVEDINVFPAGFPVEYGDALGGVIDTQLRAPKNDRTHYKFDISTITGAFLVEGPAGEPGKDSYYIAGRRSYIDLLLSPQDFNDLILEEEGENANRINLVPRFYDLQSLYRHILPRGSIDYYLFAASDEQRIDIRDAANSDPQFVGELQNREEFQTLGTTWRQRWNETQDHVVNFSLNRDESLLSLGTDENGDPFFANVEATALLLQPELRWKVNSRTQANIGVAAETIEAPVDLYISRPPREDDINFDLTTQTKYRINRTVRLHQVAPYLKLHRQWGDRWTTRLGLRYTDLALSGGFHAREFSPRATLEYQASVNTLLSASWGRYIQQPDATEILDDFGNPGLAVIEAEHRILGWEQKLDNTYSFKLEAYHKPLKNLVVPLDDQAPPDNYANRGTGEAYGVDVFIKREPARRKIGWLGLSLAKSERTNEVTGVTRDFSGDQPVSLTAVWGQPFSGSWSDWDWGIKAQIHSGTPYTRVIGRHREDPNDPNSRWIPEFGEHNGDRTPTYYKIDLRIGRQLASNNAKVKVYLDLQNITFNNNVVGYDYGDEYQRIERPKEIVGIGFFPFFGAEVEF